MAAPHKKTTIKLVVKKADNVVLPFTAKIKRTNADGTERIIYEQGTWSGVAYYSSILQVEEEDIKQTVNYNCTNVCITIT